MGHPHYHSVTNYSSWPSARDPFKGFYIFTLLLLSCYMWKSEDHFWKRLQTQIVKFAQQALFPHSSKGGSCLLEGGRIPLSTDGSTGVHSLSAGSSPI